MPPSPRPAGADRRTREPLDPDVRSRVIVAAFVAWLVPGGAHALHGQAAKALVFFAALVTMFTVGIAAGGRLFPLQPSDPLVFLEALAEWCIGLPRVIAGVAGLGAGTVEAPSYEYGNTFLLVSGLLNALVILDAVDVVSGRKARR
jgi:hypothetical protein